MIAAVMLVKDEADVIEHTVRHLLGQLDRVYVADNMSRDGTYDILKEMRDEFGVDRLTVGLDDQVAYYQDRKTTFMAHVAFNEGAHFVVPCDADELWYSTSDEFETVGAALESLRLSAAEVVEAQILNHVCTALDPDDANPFTRMGYRLVEVGKLPKVAVRADLHVHIEMGNHGAWFDHGNPPVVVKNLLAIRHFPYRSAEHFIRKAMNGYRAYKETQLPESIGGHWRAYGRMIEEHGPDAGAAWFREHFFYPDPATDSRLMYDRAPV